jgi:hypothetical protein
MSTGCFDLVIDPIIYGSEFNPAPAARADCRASKVRKVALRVVLAEAT